MLISKMCLTGYIFTERSATGYKSIEYNENAKGPTSHRHMMESRRSLAPLSLWVAA